MTATQRTAGEIKALTRIAFDELAAATGGIHGVHAAIAGRVFRAVGPQARPVAIAHDAVSRMAYGAIAAGARLAGNAAAIAAARAAERVEQPVSATPVGGTLVAVLNGLVGDTLEREGSELAQDMSVRIDGRVVALDADSVRVAFPAATPRLVVFVHGLMETERAWWLGAGAGGRTYGDRLHDDLSCTAVYLRYNTGLRVSENGRRLSALLQRLLDAWPCSPQEVALVGHSMGGLVSRSACHQAAQADERWVRLVRHVVSLGTPHLGAPMEAAVHYAGHALHALPETRPLASFLRRRSAGIRDLRQGSLVDEDWQGRDPDALRAAACAEIPLLGGATHCFVAATVTRSPRHPLGRLVGDWLVLEPSASGRGRTRHIPFEAEHGMHLGGAHHFALLNHPRVYEALRGWLATAPVR